MSIDPGIELGLTVFGITVTVRVSVEVAAGLKIRKFCRR